MARTLQARGEEVIEVWEKDPSVQAFQQLADRVIDRPAEQKAQIEVDTGWEKVIQRLQAARLRGKQG